MIATQLYRTGNKLHRLGIPGAAFIFKILIRLVCNCAIDPRTKIGIGSFFAYGGIATVIHKNCIIGKNVTIAQCVTIGGRSGACEVPRIGDNVYVGAGAIVLGAIEIGDGVVIGAGSVVLKDIPAGEVWAGVPAKKIEKSKYTPIPTT